MDNLDTNRLNMIRTTHDYCVDKAAATAAIAQYAVTVTSVKNKITLIDALNIIASGTTTGVTLDTNLLRATMSDLAYKCGSATFAYASSVNNNTLMAQVKTRRSEFDGFKKEEVDDICQGIHDAANANIVAAGPFGITPLDITDLQTAINLYVAGMQGPRQARISISSAKDQIKDNISQTIQKLLKEQLDRMTDTLKQSNNVYYSEYYMAREIIDLGSTTGKIRGTVSDNGGNALDGVLFSIFKTGSTDLVASTTSSGGGKFSASNLPAGDYDLVWELATFQPVRENNVHLAAGKELKRVITMLPV
ncbi:MAG: carboxypeptidase-like regulatory domain-containing protein [Bacteroidia bacterium]